MTRWFKKECFRTLYFGVLRGDAPQQRAEGCELGLRISDQKKPKVRFFG